MIAPLSKEIGGKLYTRPPEIEARLKALVSLSPDEFIECAGISKRTDRRYVPSECLVYFIRESRSDNDDVRFEQLYKILLKRVYNLLPRADSRDGKTTSAMTEKIRNDVVDRFTTLLLEDRQALSDKLDFYEVRFDMKIRRLRLTAQKAAWRDRNRSAAFEDEDTGEPTSEVEAAAQHAGLSDFAFMDDPGLRERFEAAIDRLPENQSRTMHMLMLGYQVESADAEEMTISKALGKTPRSIRNYKERALANLRAVFSGEDRR